VACLYHSSKSHLPLARLPNFKLKTQFGMDTVKSQKAQVLITVNFYCIKQHIEQFKPFVGPGVLNLGPSIKINAALHI